MVVRPPVVEEWYLKDLVSLLSEILFVCGGGSLTGTDLSQTTIPDERQPSS